MVCHNFHLEWLLRGSVGYRYLIRIVLELNNPNIS